jgi:tetratricopeptide (TPR) repeat protein
MNIIKYLLLFAFVLHLNVRSQDADRILDSLSGLAKKATNDSIKANLLCECGAVAGENQLHYLYPALEIAKRIGSRWTILRAYGGLADYYASYSIIADSCYYYNIKAIDLGKQINSKVRIGARYDNLSYLFGTYYRNEKLARKYLDTALFYLKEPVNFEFDERRRRFTLIKALSSSVEFDLIDKEYEKALKGIKEVVALKREFKMDDFDDLGLLTNMGNVFLGVGRTDTAIAIFNSIRSIAARDGDAGWETYSYALLCNAYGKTNFNKAIECGEQGVRFGMAQNSTKEVIDNYYSLIDACKLNKAFEKALYYTNAERNFSDSLRSTTEGDLLSRYEKGLKAEKEKLEFELLQVKNDRQKVYTIIAIGVVLLLVLFAFFMVNRFRVTNKQKKIIESQKELVEQKQKEIIDSITYAKRIQTARMSNEKYIDKILKKLNK